MMLKRWITVGMASALLLAGCNKVEEVQNQSEKPVKEEEPVVEEVSKTFQAPLTGVDLSEEPSGRAFGVMINNDPKARPQSALNQADIVYEVLAEGNVTRFLAIFQSEHPENIGPVRSARDYYIDLASGYDALYIAHGYSPEAQEMLTSGVIDNLNGMQYDGTLFQRASFRQPPHNSYISYESILKGAKQVGYDMTETPDALPFYEEEELVNISGETAEQVTVAYLKSNLFKVDYKYDASSKKYARYSNDEQTIDLDSEEPVLLDNVLIVAMEHELLDDSGRREIDLTSGGKGYLLQQGKLIDVEWKNIDGRILPFLNGEEVKFVPGKTWINIVPTNPGLEQTVTIQ
jgi:hypothetical protein